jgi:hypothetical protein
LLPAGVSDTRRVVRSKQARADFVFEFGDADRKRRLSHRDPLRRLRERAQFGHRQEVAQQIAIHRSCLSVLFDTFNFYWRSKSITWIAGLQARMRV